MKTDLSSGFSILKRIKTVTRKMCLVNEYLDLLPWLRLETLDRPPCLLQLMDRKIIKFHDQIP